MTAVIHLDNIFKSFGKTPAVDGVSLEINDGEFFALLGPSGCGKTTLLRILGGFDIPDRGRVLMDGKDITRLPPNRRPVNMLFQSYAIFPHMTVGDNVGYGLRVTGVGRQETKRRVGEALELVRMSEVAGRMPDKLSGGQRQRVALARALVKRPRVLLLDEPLSALDAKLREAMRGELKNLQNTVGITFITVTHDQNEALSMAGRIAVMESGKFRQVAAPRVLYESPNSLFVADFIGRMNIIPCVVTALSADGCRANAEGIGEVAVGGGTASGCTAAGGGGVDGVRAGDAAYCAIRPEKLTFSTSPPESDGADSGGADASGGAVYAAEVESFAYQGDGALLQCRCCGAKLTCWYPNSARAAPPPDAGASGWLSWAAEDMLLLKR